MRGFSVTFGAPAVLFLFVWVLAGCSASSCRSRDAAMPPPPLAHDAPAGGRTETVLTYVEAQIGKPYCWGGEGPRCFDCSGLAQMAWAHAGVHIPRTSHDIAHSLPEVSLRDVRPGDILWWPGHVAIYEGYGWMID
ncbi:MAG TPA: NlpC/P60 family protein, partial [Polyangiaceae bacterium]|nr:NlpC/P60 family protein [Polyangiaceae bacterium]